MEMTLQKTSIIRNLGGGQHLNIRARRQPPALEFTFVIRVEHVIRLGLRVFDDVVKSLGFDSHTGGGQHLQAKSVHVSVQDPKRRQVEMPCPRDGRLPS